MEEVDEDEDVVAVVDVESLVQKEIHQRETTRRMKARLSHSRWRTPQQRAPLKLSTTWMPSPLLPSYS